MNSPAPTINHRESTARNFKDHVGSFKCFVKENKYKSYHFKNDYLTDTDFAKLLHFKTILENFSDDLSCISKKILPLASPLSCDVDVKYLSRFSIAVLTVQSGGGYRCRLERT
ncbi:hypothetical protein PUN28_001161 [Cardiocondyla obscurior]|uniref:Uncharacterized protein n=1 Tax=Cardiocondyla obscurior TaxID=286306 RepID=A0AAW2H3H3_9HYME